VAALVSVCRSLLTTCVRSFIKLRLYVANPTFEATAAIAQVHSLLQKLGSSYILEVLDVNDHRALALEDAVPFTPILLRLEPLPVIRISMPASNISELEAALKPAPFEIVRSAVA
jgi:hypothetical protein